MYVWVLYYELKKRKVTKEKNIVIKNILRILFNNLRLSYSNLVSIYLSFNTIIKRLLISPYIYYLYIYRKYIMNISIKYSIIIKFYT